MAENKDKLQMLFNSPHMSRSHMYEVAENTLYILTIVN